MAWVRFGLVQFVHGTVRAVLVLGLDSGEAGFSVPQYSLTRNVRFRFLVPTSVSAKLSDGSASSSVPRKTVLTVPVPAG